MQLALALPLAAVLSLDASTEAEDAAASRASGARATSSGCDAEALATSAGVVACIEARWRAAGAIDAELRAAAERAFDELGASTAITSPNAADAHEEWGLLLFVNGDTTGALDQMRQALSQRLQLEGPTSPRVAATLARVGKLHLLAGDPERALRLFERALAIRSRGEGGSMSADADELRLRIAIAHRLGGAAEEAVPLLEEVVRWRTAHASDRVDCPRALLAELYRSAGETGRATPALDDGTVPGSAKD